MRRQLFATATALLLSLAASGAAQADDEDGAGKVIAVELRPYRLGHEFALSAGVLPMDALYKGLSLGGSYTLHFTELWAWEIVDFHYSANVDTGLDTTLARRWAVAPTTEPQFQYVLGTQAIFTPLSGKLALFDKNLLYAEIYLALGGGVAHFSDGFRPEITVGPGVRIYWSQLLSTRLDIRSMLAPDQPSGVAHVLQVMLSVAFNFGAPPAEVAVNADDHAASSARALDELYPGSDPEPTKSAPAPAPEPAPEGESNE